MIDRQAGKDESSTTPAGPTRRASTILPKYVIDSSSDKGLKLSSVLGNIEFENVKFAYPTRQETNVLDGFSLNVEAGSTVALVGPRYVQSFCSAKTIRTLFFVVFTHDILIFSGCGKSTTIQLVERFYDVLAGSVKLDFHDLRELNVHWLRQQIGLVSQVCCHYRSLWLVIESLVLILTNAFQQN